MTYSWAVAIFLAVPIGFALLQVLAVVAPPLSSGVRSRVRVRPTSVDSRRQRDPGREDAGEILRDASYRKGEGTVQARCLGAGFDSSRAFAQSTPSLGVRGVPTPRSGG